MSKEQKKVLTYGIVGILLFVTGVVLFIVGFTIKRPVVTFKNDDGTVLATVKVAIGKTAVYPETKAPVKNSGPSDKGYRYVFQGWDDSLENIQEDKEVVAKYSRIAISYKIAYNLNKGAFLTENVKQNYTIEESFILPTPTKEGCTFQGWYVANQESKLMTSINQGSMGDLELFAKWDAPSFEIHYELDGGTQNAEAPTSYTIQDEVELLAPTKEGFVFGGWYLQADYQGDSKIEKIEEGTTGNLTLYAKWMYEISYELNGGFNDKLAPKAYSELEKTTLPIPTKVGYQFSGWYFDADFTGDAIYLLPKGTTDAKTLHAKWETVADGVIFEENGEKYMFFGSYPQSVVTDQTIIHALEELNPIEKYENRKNAKEGYYEYNGKRYLCIVASPYASICQFNYKVPAKKENADSSFLIEDRRAYYFFSRPNQMACIRRK